MEYTNPESDDKLVYLDTPSTEVVDQNNGLVNRELVLDFSKYSLERERLTKWLVPWQDNPYPGKYTLIIQSAFSTTKIIRETMPNGLTSQLFFENDTLNWTKEEYIEELNRLLTFMSDTDKKKTIDRYQTMLSSTDNEVELMKELGTPQKLAVSLAKNYLSTDEKKADSTGESEAKPQETTKNEVNEKESSQQKFRSVAQSVHTNEKRELDDNLAMFVDMSTDKDVTEAKEENSEKFERQVIVCKPEGNPAKRLFPKTKACFIALGILEGIIVLIADLLIFLPLSASSLILAYVPLKAFYKININPASGNLLIFIGITIISVTAAIGILITGFFLCRWISKSFILFMKKGIRLRKKEKGEDK